MTKNKISLFLSALAIALVALLIMHFKGLKLFNQVSASGLDNSQAISELYDYVESLNSFTDEQKASLNSMINDYFKNQKVVTEEDLDLVYQLIDEKYQANIKNLQDIRNELQLQINSTQYTDNSRYNELKKLIEEIDILLGNVESKNAEYVKSLNEIIADLRAYSDYEDTKLQKNIDALQSPLSDLRNDITKLQDKTTNQQNSINTLNEKTSNHQTDIKNLQDKTGNHQDALNSHQDAITILQEKIKTQQNTLELLQSEITKINNRTTDPESNSEFKFGYKDGFYGYYINGTDFKPF